MDIHHRVWYGMRGGKRAFISVYFADALVGQRKKRDITLAFSHDDTLYARCRQLGSSGIKQAIGVTSYSELARAASDDGRPLANYVKHRLRRHFENEQEDPSS